MDAHERLYGPLDEASLTGRSHRRRVDQLLVRVAAEAVGRGRRRRVVSRAPVVVGRRFVLVAAAAERFVRRPVAAVLVDVHLSGHGALWKTNAAGQ